MGTYRSDYGSPIPLPHLVQRVSSYMHAYTLYSSIRPFGATSMLGSWSKEAGAQLYCIEPSGTGYGYWGCAAGKAKSAAKTELESSPMVCTRECRRMFYRMQRGLPSLPWKRTATLTKICHNFQRIPFQESIHFDLDVSPNFLQISQFRNRRR